MKTLITGYQNTRRNKLELLPTVLAVLAYNLLPFLFLAAWFLLVSTMWAVAYLDLLSLGSHLGSY